MSRIQELEEILTRASIAYYDTGDSELSDAQYDLLFLELKSLDPNNKLFQTAGKGYVVSNEKERYEHPIEVGSIEFRTKDLSEILKKLDSNSTFSLKIDGNSFVHYLENQMSEAMVSRGSENVGLNRTDKFVAMKKIPMKVDFCPKTKVAVRGEVAIPKKKFTAENGFDVSKSNRNSVTGAISRQTDWELVFKHLDFITYTFIDCSNSNDLSELEWEKAYKVERQKPVYKNGVPVTVEELKRLVDECEYECDGIVFRNSDGELFAFKFEDETAPTKCLDLFPTIGSGQRLTPIASLEPVNLSGATIRKASVGSYSIAKTLGLFPLRQNTVVEIIRSNEIIPMVTKVVSFDDKIILDKVLCPCCQTEAEFNGAHMFCVNPQCPNIEKEFLYKFCSFFTPEGLKEKTLEKVFEHYDIESVYELLTCEIDFDELTEIDGIGESASNLIEQMFEKFSEPVDSKILYKTFITGCGERASKAIVNCGFKFEDYIVEEDGYDGFETLYKLPNFNSNIISELMTECYRIAEVAELLNVVDLVEIVGDKTFCISGVRLNEEQSKKAKLSGWEEKSGVSKNVDMLVVKDATKTSSKIEKAKSLGVSIVSLEDFLKMIEK